MTDAPDTASAAASPAPAAAAPPPDRLSVDPKSPYFDGDALARGIGIIFKGQERFNVEEYCVSEGWVRLAMAKTRDRKGNPLTMKLSGPVEPFFATALRPRRNRRTDSSLRCRRVHSGRRGEPDG